MKNIIRILLLCLIISLLLITAISCNRNNDSTTAATTNSEANTTTPPVTEEEDITFEKDMLSSFKIVYADKSTDAVIESAKTLSNLISKTIGAELLVTSDFLREGSSTYTEYEYEILIGLTNRTASTEYTPALRLNDYGYVLNDKKIVITGLDSFSTLAAIREFSMNIVIGKSDESVFYSSAWDKTFEMSYLINDFNLNGTDIRAFSIVYGAAGSFEKELALKLKKAIADKTGYILSVKAQKDAVNDKNVLYVGNKTELNSADGKGYILKSDDTVIIGGKTAMNCKTATEAFIAKITADDNKVCNLTVNTAEIFTEDTSIYSTMTFNVLVSPITVERTDRVIATITDFMPDVFGVQEASHTWMTNLNTRLYDYYASEGTSADDGSNQEHCAIFYAKEKFTLLETKTLWLSDTPEKFSKIPGTIWTRVFTYVYLESIETGEKFVVVNCHLDTASSEVRTKGALVMLESLKKFNDVPVILMGDLNGNINSTEVKTLINNGFNDTTVNSGNIDFVLATGDSIEMSNCIVAKERINGDYASDHYAVYGEFKFKELDEIDHGWGEIKENIPDGGLTLNTDEENPNLGEIHRIP